MSQGQELVNSIKRTASIVLIRPHCNRVASRDTATQWILHRL